MLKKIAIIIDLLNQHYGKKKWQRQREPVGELVRTILSQNTTDKNSLRAYANLINKYDSWEKVLKAEEAEIAEAIRIGGLANIKARKIKRGLAEIKRREKKIDLEFLAEMDLEQAQEYLLSLDGVGPKTAACVLIFSFNFPVLPVDTHVHRLANRLGLVKTKTREKTQETLKDLIPDKDIFSFHLNLIEHGRRVCKASNPKCNECFLNDLCAYFSSLRKQRK